MKKKKGRKEHTSFPYRYFLGVIPTTYIQMRKNHTTRRIYKEDSKILSLM